MQVQMRLRAVAGIADRADHPKIYATLRALLIAVVIAATISGAIWSRTMTPLH